MILVVAEQRNGVLAKSAYELVSAARGCGVQRPMAMLLLGAGEAAQKAAELVDVVFVAEAGGYDAEVWSAAVAQVAKQHEASIVLLAASRSGREWSPRAAVKLDAALLEDVASLKTEDGALTAERFAFLNRVTERIAVVSERAVVSVKPGAFAAAEPLQAKGRVETVTLDLPARRLHVTPQPRQASGRIALEEAAIVVSGGRGVGSAEGFTATVEALADRLGAAVGATRAIVDAGWRPYEEQVGQTGKTVQPKLYIALGISGAVQHLSGMNKSGTIVAVNKDKDAPIFKVADLGVVGDVGAVVSAVLAELKQ